MVERLMLELFVSPECLPLSRVFSILKTSESEENCVSDCESFEVTCETYDDPSKSLKPTGCTSRVVDIEGVDEGRESTDITSIGRFLLYLAVSLLSKMREGYVYYDAENILSRQEKITYLLEVSCSIFKLPVELFTGKCASGG